jgi:hypothetical protein
VPKDWDFLVSGKGAGIAAANERLSTARMVRMMEVGFILPGRLGKSIGNW